MLTREKEVQALNGWLALAILIGFGVMLGAGFWYGAVSQQVPLVLILGFFALVWLLCLNGFYTLQPNEAAVWILFGKYTGTDKTSGFRWANPLLRRLKISMRRRNLNGEVIKVNDLRGNPIEIGAVVVWHVSDTARAAFDVDNYDHYVRVQSEAALRHLAMAYPYDTYHEQDTLSLRGSTDEVSRALEKEIEERVNKAGVTIEEARLSHLAYAPEIASAMLQRQQAEAIVAARSRIVDGAVGMVEMALDQLSKYKGLELDEERKAAMVSNLLVVLCSHESAHPVVNAGTLYH